MIIFKITIMKKLIIILTVFSVVITVISTTSSCTVTKAISEKSGATLWGENCLRCHNTPTPTDFSDAHWETIGMHMRLRANLTNEEVKKVVAFLQSAN
jgi:cytochrome c1